ncbi:MAG: hypothetical protein WCK48_03030 [bacterium]
MKKVLKKPKKISGIPLSVVATSDKVFMLSRENKKTTASLFLSCSTNGIDFEDEKKPVKIEISSTKKENIKNCENFSISSTPTAFILTYVRKGKKKEGNMFVVARSKDLHVWSVKSEVSVGDSTRATVLYNKTLDMFEMYRDGLFVKHQHTRSLMTWKDRPSLLFTSRYGMFDNDNVSVIGSLVTSQGIFLSYGASAKNGTYSLLQVGGVLLDARDPKRVLWRSETPLWQGMVELKNEKTHIFPIGFVSFKGIFIVYYAQGQNLILATFPALFKQSELPQYRILKKSKKNPIIEPRENHEWEIQGTFNPAVFQDEEGVVHLLYRALGSDGISRVGYAQSKNGTSFTKRLPYPVYQPSRGYGMPDIRTHHGPTVYHPAYYTSGGGWGGSEDPRVVKIDDTLYMIYVAFEGWHSVRMAVTSISIEDFHNGKWNWKKPILISPIGEVNKNWLLFPEKISGKFAILHSITPKIHIDYVSDLEDFNKGKIIKSSAPQGGREDFWDFKVRGAGPPPIKTSLGWLMLYHATEKREPNKYKLGAMILDLKDPTKILYRSNHPILYPDMWYENEGKPGVVYASGAIVRGDDLYVYYGGGDRVVCVATTPLGKLLEYLKTGKPDNYTLQKADVPIE